MHILLLSGSFHSKSKTLALIAAIKSLLPEHLGEMPQLDQLPFFSEDLNQHKPEMVQAFLAQVSSCDAIICVTPEYNHSIPAVLKNAIDWASRPAFASPLKGKPVTIVTQADSPVGGARAQAHLKLVLDSTLSRIHPSHEMMISDVKAVFNDELKLVDETVKRRLKRHLDDFITFAQGAIDSTT